MEWVTFIIGGITFMFGYLLFSTNNDLDDSDDELDETESDLIVNHASGRHVTLSCQSCRKLKKHKEIKSNLFQCTKCKRQVDLRAS